MATKHFAWPVPFPGLVFSITPAAAPPVMYPAKAPAELDNADAQVPRAWKAAVT